MSIENPTLPATAGLVHFLPSRGSGTAGRHFSSLFTNLPSTLVERPLQIALFMQNKPNLLKSQMNVSIFSQKDYENKSNWTLGENKPNTNPIKPNFRKAKMNVNSLITKDYRKNDAFAVQKNKPNQTQFQRQKNAPAFDIYSPHVSVGYVHIPSVLARKRGFVTYQIQHCLLIDSVQGRPDLRYWLSTASRIKNDRQDDFETVRYRHINQDDSRFYEH